MTALALVMLCAPLARAQDTPPADHDMASMPGMANMPGMSMPMDGMAGMKMNSPDVGMAGVSGTLGFYPYERESSGTSWRPDDSPREGWRLPLGPWLAIVQGEGFAGYDHLDGGRGGQGGFAAGVITGSIRRDFGDDDILQARLRVSPDTVLLSDFADGQDRQPARAPLQEAAVAYSHRIDFNDTVFAYAGVMGQPAYGAPLWYDRQSSGDSPLAPIGAARPDATEAAAGVITGGWTLGDLKVEGSSFNGRASEPGRPASPSLGSWAARLSFNPGREWALQASWATLKSPSAAGPAPNPDRWSVSALYSRPLGDAGWWATTALYDRTGRLSAALLESAAGTGPWTVFARAEQADLTDLVLADGPAQTARKLSLGGVHDWKAGEHLKIGLGALYAFAAPPGALRSGYGDAPGGAMVFLRLKLG